MESSSSTELPNLLQELGYNCTASIDVLIDVFKSLGIHKNDGIQPGQVSAIVEMM